MCGRFVSRTGAAIERYFNVTPRQFTLFELESPKFSCGDYPQLRRKFFIIGYSLRSSEVPLAIGRRIIMLLQMSEHDSSEPSAAKHTKGEPRGNSVFQGKESSDYQQDD